MVAGAFSVVACVLTAHGIEEQMGPGPRSRRGTDQGQNKPSESARGREGQNGPKDLCTVRTRAGRSRVWPHSQPLRAVALSPSSTLNQRFSGRSDVNKPLERLLCWPQRRGKVHQLQTHAGRFYSFREQSGRTLAREVRMSSTFCILTSLQPRGGQLVI